MSLVHPVLTFFHQSTSEFQELLPLFVCSGERGPKYLEVTLSSLLGLTVPSMLPLVTPWEKREKGRGRGPFVGVGEDPKIWGDRGGRGRRVLGWSPLFFGETPCFFGISPISRGSRCFWGVPIFRGVSLFLGVPYFSGVSLFFMALPIFGRGFPGFGVSLFFFSSSPIFLESKFF